MTAHLDWFRPAVVALPTSEKLAALAVQASDVEDWPTALDLARLAATVYEDERRHACPVCGGPNDSSMATCSWDCAELMDEYRHGEEADRDARMRREDGPF